MRSQLVCFLLLVFACSTFAQEKNITTFILIRHAEKANDGTSDPPLSSEGEERAKRLVPMLKNEKVDAIYSTKFNRTRSTVKALAESKNLSVQIYENMKSEDLLQLVDKYKGGTIVIAGHSNTIPAIANLLTGKDEYKTFADTDYGNLLIVSVVTTGKDSKVTWLAY